MKSSLKWQQAKPIYPSDHIVSSKARELGIIGFKPEYEEEKHVNVRFILSNEYMRLWFKERQLYQKENYAKQENTRTDSHIRRGYVQRMMTNPKLDHRELPVIQLKRFQNIMSKVENGRTAEDKTKICSRFKKTVEPVVLQRFKPTGTTNRPLRTSTVKPAGASLKKEIEDRVPGDPGCALHCRLQTE